MNTAVTAILLLSFLSCVTTSVGVVLAIWLGDHVRAIAAVGLAPALNAYFMAFAAGAMLFVTIHELIPMAQRYKHGALFLLGFIVSIVVYFGLGAVTQRLG